MHFDVLFLDVTANKYYDRITLEKEALGGSEATVVRVAEGLARLGLSVAVVQSQVPFFEPTMGQHCFFLHSDSLDSVTCRHYIQLRENKHPHLFNKAKKYIWMHDNAHESDKSWLPSLIENKIKILGVSRWHKKGIQKMLPEYQNIDYVYNPVEDNIFITPETELTYDPNLLVWASSPHKGLGNGLKLFKQLKEKNDKFQLVLFNPGYHNLDNYTLSTIPGVSVYGPSPCKMTWAVIQKALCVFYPTEWYETFGLVAAEANALGTPIATYRKGALKEVVSSDNQMVEDGDGAGLLEKVLDWSKNGRPKVIGKDEFRYMNVILDWVRLLAE